MLLGGDVDCLPVVAWERRPILLSDATVLADLEFVGEHKGDWRLTLSLAEIAKLARSPIAGGWLSHSAKGSD